MLHGGHLSFLAQLVKDPLFIVVIPPFLFEETPYILGSLLELSKLFFFILILVLLAMKSFVFILKIPSSKK